MNCSSLAQTLRRNDESFSTAYHSLERFII